MASGPAALGPARLDAVIALPSDGSRMGGFSGIELSPDGREFILISDRGRILRGEFHRENNRLIDETHDRIAPLRTTDGAPVRGKGNDAEGAALAPDGTLFVSFEGQHRLRAYAPGETTARDVPVPPEFARLPGNGGIEALAIAPDGTLYALPERIWTRNGGLPLFRGTDQGWDQLPGYPRNGGFLPVGADLGPDGRMYILERHFKGLGFASRVRSFALDARGLHDPRIILQTPQRRHGNLEGLSVWRDTDGHIRLTMVSDDNFLSLMRSEIVEYTLPKSLANKGAND